MGGPGPKKKKLEAKSSGGWACAIARLWTLVFRVFRIFFIFWSFWTYFWSFWTFFDQLLIIFDLFWPIFDYFWPILDHFWPILILPLPLPLIVWLVFLQTTINTMTLRSILHRPSACSAGGAAPTQSPPCCVVCTVAGTRLCCAKDVI